MLQTAEEDEHGRVKWRDLTCQDADDFDECVKFNIFISDIVCGDMVAAVPFGEQMVWRNPLEMCAAEKNN